MINKGYFFTKIKDVKVIDILEIIPMICAILLIPFFKKKYSKTWLICEESIEARDNGFFFFRYICLNHPNQKCVYAIKRKSPDFQKVKSLGSTIEFGGIKHWLYYFIGQYNISSQKGGKPNAALCAFMELNNVWHPRNIFLQHGVTINDAEWLYAKNCKFDMFITATKPETDFILKNFGYHKNIIKLTGFPRFDNLQNYKTIKNRILIMPTWRVWFRLKSKQNSMTDNDFEHSEYLQKWKEFLSSYHLKRIIDENNIEIIFYPHRNMQKYLAYFKDIHENITIASQKEYDVPELLKSSQLLITDYSSVFFDMIYMRKPIIFYQFDEKKFRNYHYGQGYFNYHKNPFGKSFNHLSDVVQELENIIKSNYSVPSSYLDAHKDYFPYYDSDNSKRIYDLL